METTLKPSTELTIAGRAAVALGSSAHELELRELVQSSCRIVEIKNPAAHDECHSAYMAITRAMTTIDKAGTDARSDANKFRDAVIAEVKRLFAIAEPEKQRLLALRDAWRAKLEAEKVEKIRVERERTDTIKSAIAAINNEVALVIGKSAEFISQRLARVDELILSADFYAEFHGEAVTTQAEVCMKLVTMRDEAMAREAAELKAKQEREAEAERLRQQAIENNRIRDELIAQAKAQQEAAARLAIAQKAEADRMQAIEDERRRINDLEIERQQAAVRAEYAEIEKKMVIERAAIAEAQKRIDAHNAEIAEAELAEYNRIQQEDMRTAQEQAKTAKRIEQDRQNAEEDARHQREYEQQLTRDEPAPVVEVLANGQQQLDANTVLSVDVNSGAITSKLIAKSAEVFTEQSFMLERLWVYASPSGAHVTFKERPTVFYPTAVEYIRADRLTKLEALRKAVADYLIDNKDLMLPYSGPMRDALADLEKS
jgi:hypothetical protein